MFIQTEQTPNPNALKFLPGREVMGSKPPKFYKKDPKGNPTEDSPLAYSLFTIEGIEDVFFGSDFITVGKSNDFDWDILKPSILNEISEHSENPYVVEQLKPACENLNSNVGESKITKKIIEILNSKVRPAVAQDGGDIIFHSFKDHTVYLEMKGACSGCPSSTATLKMGIENMLKHYLPEVHTVESI